MSINTKRLEDIAYKSGMDAMTFNRLKNTLESYTHVVVEECIQQVNKNNFGGREPWDPSRDRAAYNIKEYFGV